MAAYYNEIDPYAAQWLRNLISAGHIAPGDVDERSIEDVRSDEVQNYTQAHFFAGIGVWSYALRSAGWNDNRAVWTGSCPCQPFSAAGKGAGFDDERHLWPAWFHLISECKPANIFGEQVAGKNGLGWLDLVQADLESTGYACGACVTPAAGFGAPHIRERLYWVAYADNARPQGRNSSELRQCAEQRASGPGSSQSRLGHAESIGRERRPDDGNQGRRQRASGQAGEACGVGNSKCVSARRNAGPSAEAQGETRLRTERDNAGTPSTAYRSHPTNGFWENADWLLCTDGKWRPVEPGTFPLADGVANRVDKLRAYGNAIVAPQAQAFIEAAMAYRP